MREALLARAPPLLMVSRQAARVGPTPRDGIIAAAAGHAMPGAPIVESLEA